MRPILIAGISALALLGQIAPTHAENTPSGIVAKKVGAGWVFTDQKGMSLYIYDQDKPGQSKCMGQCATVWPPVVATTDADTTGSADWSIVDRGDGKKQIAFRGMPLYSYVKDPTPGTTFGDGVALSWRVARRDMETPSEIVIGSSNDGLVLTDSKGRTLYFNDGDKPQAQRTTEPSGKLESTSIGKLKSACTKHCLDSWKPLMAPMIAVGGDDWSIVAREDGLRQWTFRGKALYVAAREAAATNRDSDWHPAVVEPAPPAPSWLTYQPSDGGEIAANAAGHTVYALTDNPKAQDWRSSDVCKADCIRTYWRPVAAAPDAKPIGNWTIVKGFDGTNQWTYKGELLFTYARDKEPGEIAGSRFLTRAWHTITRSGDAMEGMDKR